MRQTVLAQFNLYSALGPGPRKKFSPFFWRSPSNFLDFCPWYHGRFSAYFYG
ncbi:hypothetical protein D082_21960 [Synechocystis sp. PCC 6714]|nr:hypothetical protein D082_21960 [Synechocystis sp. PCC 6714]